MSLLELYLDEEQKKDFASAEDSVLVDTAAEPGSNTSEQPTTSTGHRRSQRLKRKSNITNQSSNRKGSYIARRIAKAARSEAVPGPRAWTLKEKRALLEALEKTDNPEDYQSLSKRVVTRTPEEIQLFVEGRESHMMKHKDQYMHLFNLKEPPPPPSLELWSRACSHKSSDLLSNALYEALKVASFEPLSVAERRMDFSLMYNYLANLVAGKELPALSPLEAVILWDILSEAHCSVSVKENEECLQHLTNTWRKLSSKANTGSFRSNVNRVDEKLEDTYKSCYEEAAKEGLLGSPTKDLSGGDKVASLEEAVSQLTGHQSTDFSHPQKAAQCYSFINPLYLPARLNMLSKLENSVFADDHDSIEESETNSADT